MNSSWDNSDVASYIASRTRRTHARQSSSTSPAGTRCLSLLAVIGCHLSGRMNRDRLVAGFEIHGIELSYLVEPHDMPEVPAHHDVGVRHRGQGDVEHVVPKAGPAQS